MGGMRGIPPLRVIRLLPSQLAHSPSRRCSDPRSSRVRSPERGTRYEASSASTNCHLLLCIRSACNTSHSPIRIQNCGRRTRSFSAGKKNVPHSHPTATAKMLSFELCFLKVYDCHKQTHRNSSSFDITCILIFDVSQGLKAKLMEGQNKRIKSTLQFPFCVYHFPSIWCNKRPE
jgi:hypothetical protein